MTITLTITDKVRVPVEGSFTNEAGKPLPFAFTLTCKRLGAAALRERLDKPQVLLKDLLADLVLGWEGVTYGDTGGPAPYTREALDQLLDLPGVAALAWTAYTAEQSAKAKEKN